MNRRNILKVGGAALGATTLGALTLHQSSQPTLAASLTAANVGVTTEDGQISSVDAGPSLTIEFDGFDQPIDQFEIALLTKTGSESSWVPADGSSSSNGYVAMANLTSASTAGTRQVDVAPIALRSGSNTESLDADTDGKTNTTTLSLRVVVQASDSSASGDSFNGFKLVKQTTAETTFDVSVTNDAATISASGSANTGISK